MMRLLRNTIIVLSGITSISSAAAEHCQTSNRALEAMPPVKVEFTLPDGQSHQVVAKLADNNVTRAAGFQRVCASVIAAEPMLFVFQKLRKPSFHMHNVVAPIDIAFIRKDGSIDSVHAMQPYSPLSRKKPLYRSEGPVIAALEVSPGYFDEHHIDKTATIVWQRTVATPSDPANQD